ncbi:MAG: PIN domain-containing protein [Nitrospirota bacterium]
MKRLYLDMNIYNRPFDDQSQVRIRLETIAIYATLKAIKERRLSLIWSFMLEFENSLNPYEDIRMEIEMASSLASETINMAEDILVAAKNLESKGIKPRDAIHLACAIKGKADYFLTCDDKLIRKGQFIKSEIEIISPVDFIRLGVK